MLPRLGLTSSRLFGRPTLQMSRQDCDGAVRQETVYMEPLLGRGRQDLMAGLASWAFGLLVLRF